MDRIVPKKYLGLYNKRNKSRKSAIRSQCIECCGYSEVDVRECADKGCPLWKWRLRG